MTNEQIEAKIAEHEAELKKLEETQAQNQAALQQTQVGIHQRHGAIIALREMLPPPADAVPINRQQRRAQARGKA